MPRYAVSAADAPSAEDMRKQGYTPSTIRVAFNRAVHDLEQNLKSYNEVFNKDITFLGTEWITASVIIETSAETADRIARLPGVGRVEETVKGGDVTLENDNPSP